MDLSNINEELEEKNVWSNCPLCNEEYEEDIRIIPECLHSFCYKCIVKTFANKTSQNHCPLPRCNSFFDLPLSSLPHNFALQTWRSLSPLQNSKNDNKNTHYYDTNKNINLYFSINNVNNENEHVNENDDKIDINKNEDNKENNNNNLDIKNFSEQIKKYIFKCKKHEKKKGIYCVDCSQFACIYCVDDHHEFHQLISLKKKLQLNKEQWKKQIKEEKKKIKQKMNFKIIEEKLTNQTNELEIKILNLKNELKKLEVKKEDNEKMLNTIKNIKFNFEITNRYLNTFINSLPPLPLSSYPPLSNNLFFGQLNNLNYYYENDNNKFDDNENDLNKNNEDNNYNNSNKNLENKRNSNRIKNFLEKKNILLVHSKYLPLSYSDHHIRCDRDDDDDDENPFSPYLQSELVDELAFFGDIEEEDFDYLQPLLSNEEEVRNNLLWSNQLIENQNLIRSFGSKGTLMLRFSNSSQLFNPQFISLNMENDLIAISDYSHNLVKIFDQFGNFKYLISSFSEKPSDQLVHPMSVKIIPKRKEIAVVDGGSDLIRIFNLDNGDYLFSIGLGKGSENGQFNSPKGFTFCHSLDLIIVCDQGNERLQIFRLSDGEFLAKFRLNFKPFDVDYSKSADLLVITDSFNHKLHLFSLRVIDHELANSIDDLNHRNFNNFNDNQQRLEIKLIKRKEIDKLQYGEGFHPMGVAIHPKGEYFVVADPHSQLLFFSLNGDFLTKFKPLMANGLTFFGQPFAVSIDRKEKIISVIDNSSCKISLFKSPHFHNLLLLE